MNKNSKNFCVLKRLAVIIPHLKKKGYTLLAVSVLPSILPPVTNIFHHTFLSNNASQQLQTWYGALARGPTRGLPNSVIHFRFPGSVHFWTRHFVIARMYFVSKNSQISCKLQWGEKIAFFFLCCS